MVGSLYFGIWFKTIRHAIKTVQSRYGHLLAASAHSPLTVDRFNDLKTSETAIHTLRLMGSGLFDDYSKLKIILGHLGEVLPRNIWRIDNRISRTLGAKPRAKLPIGHYLRENFYITTSGNFCTQTLTEVMMEVGADRILYSVDYPFEDVVIAAEWLDHAPISEADRSKIARGNATQLFRI